MIETYYQKVDFVDFESLNQLTGCILKSERYKKRCSIVNDFFRWDIQKRAVTLKVVVNTVYSLPMVLS